MLMTLHKPNEVAKYNVNDIKRAQRSRVKLDEMAKYNEYAWQ